MNSTAAKGIVLIDTPGLNSLIERHTQVTEQAIRERCNACIVVIPSNNPLSQTLRLFLMNNLSDILHRCIFVVTKMDLTQREKEQEMLIKNIEARRIVTGSHPSRIKLYARSQYRRKYSYWRPAPETKI
ncbi:MAG: dynamin family protein [Firmicutes bacterium]|nr:dynamin family protein [Bacillota bacterium]